MQDKENRLRFEMAGITRYPEYPEYDSPFHVTFQSKVDDIVKNAAETLDAEIWKAVLRWRVDVDEQTMVAALKQDAERYREAYRRGYETAAARLYSEEKVYEILNELFGEDTAFRWREYVYGEED